MNISIFIPIIIIIALIVFAIRVRRERLAIIYGCILIILATIDLGVYFFNIIADGIARLYVFDFFQFGGFNHTAGSPIAPILIGTLGIFTILASNIYSSLKAFSYRVGIIPLIIFTVCWSQGLLMYSKVPIPKGTESSGAEILIIGGLFLLGIIVLITLLISLFSVFKNKTYLFLFGVILLLAIILQVILSLATLPYEDPSIVFEATSKKDISICYNILEGPGRYICFQQVALATRKVEYCYLIPEEYTYIYLGQRNDYKQAQCIIKVEEVVSSPTPHNPQKFISEHGFSLDFPSDWKDYRYAIYERKARPADQYIQPEYPNGYDIIVYEFGISAEDNVFQITIYTVDHWESGIAVGPKHSARVLGEKDNLVYVAMEGVVSYDGILPNQADDIDSIIDSFKFID